MVYQNAISRGFPTAAEQYETDSLRRLVAGTAGCSPGSLARDSPQMVEGARV
jgi:hypothetical protein